MEIRRGGLEALGGRFCPLFPQNVYDAPSAPCAWRGCFLKIRTGSIKAADRAVRLAAAAPGRQGQRGCASNLSSISMSQLIAISSLLIGGDLGHARYRGSVDDNDGALRDAGRHNWLAPKDNKQQRNRTLQKRSVHLSFLSGL